MKEKMVEALNLQINKEIYSGYLYLSMSAHLDHQGYHGFAKWLKIQEQEEFKHAMKFYEYLIERGAKVKLTQIATPDSEWTSVLSVFEQALEHEKMVTSSINGLVDLARELKDHATESFLKWFIDEQVEEEANAEENVLKLTMVKDHASGLLFLDSKMGGRDE